ncbi:MAG: PAS domain S-box protein [Methanoregulaceae archaeon]|nr:PAS domain S-box protein [Methanoregulaceae archaeon]
MMRVLLVNLPESRQNLLREWEACGEITLHFLPEEKELREALSDQDYDTAVVLGGPAGAPALKTLQQIRSLDPSLPLLFLTETLDVDQGSAALQAGADCYLWDYTRDRFPDLVIPVIRNLVEHRRREEQLVRDNITMRAIHDASPVAACVIKDHKIAWVNAIIPRKLGYTEEELIGSDPVRLFPSDEEHHRIDAGLYEPAMEGGWGMVEGMLKRKDDALISCQLLSRPIDPEDPGKGQIVIGQDITDYVRIRDLLRKSEVRYQDLLDSANGIVLRVDTRGMIRFINKFGAGFFGFSPEELVGKHLVGTILPRKSSTGRDLEQMVRDVMQNPEEFEVNVNENVKRNGERVWIAWTNRTIRDDQGKVMEILTIGYDITDRSIAKESLTTRSASWISKFLEGTDIREEVFEEVYALALELSREGREGKRVGTTFMIGSAPEVLGRSTQLILNPFEGHPRSARNVIKSEIRETVKELSQIDGAFVISGDGTIEAAGRYITIDTSRASIPKGLGTRHASVAGITQETPAVGIVLSQSGGKVSLFKDGSIFRVITVRE